MESKFLLDFPLINSIQVKNIRRGMSIKAQIQQLLELQAVEIEIKNVNQSLAGIPGELDGLARQRSEFNLAIEQAETKIDVLKKQYREGEGDSQAISDKIVKEEEKLRSVKNNKEYQALLTGIEHLKNDRSEIEDKMIEFLEAIDEAEVDLAREKETFSQLDGRLSRRKEAIHLRAEQNQKQLNHLEASRTRLMDAIEPVFLDRYHHAKTLRSDGVAVAPVRDGVCRGCNMNIPPQLYNELQRHDRLLVCPNCQRIICHDPLDESDNNHR